MESAEELEREYPYGPRWANLVIRLAILTPLVVVLAFAALTSEGEGALLRKLPVSPWLATSVCWGACFFGGYLLVVTLYRIYRRVICRDRIGFTSDSIILPAGLAPGEREIAFADISRLTAQHHRQATSPSALQLTFLWHKFTIEQEMLPGEEAFTEILRLLTRKVKSRPTGSPRQHLPRHEEDDCRPGKGDGER